LRRSRRNIPLPLPKREKEKWMIGVITKIMFSKEKEEAVREDGPEKIGAKKSMVIKKITKIDIKKQYPKSL
jgi:hypothetical protein